MPIRAGSDIVFLGAIINYVLEHERYFKEYVVSYTNASAIIDERFQDTEDLDGLFSGWDPERKTYDNTTWQYAGTDDGDHAEGEHESETGQQHGGIGAPLDEAHAPRTDPTLQHPNCVFQLLRKHFRRYTPELVEEVCGVPPELFGEVAETLCENSGRSGPAASPTRWAGPSTPSAPSPSAPRPSSSCCWATSAAPAAGSWPCAGTPPSRAPPTSPPSTICCPATCPCRTPRATRTWPPTSSRTPRRAARGHTDAYLISLLKAYYGDRATADNDYCFDYLPRISGDHSTYPTTLAMLDGKVKGYFLFGENPAVGSANSGLHRKALAKLDWLVVRDLVEIESATFWRDAPEIESGELRTTDIGTEVFFLPAASHVEKRAPSPTPSGCSSGARRPSTPRATAARTCGSSTTWATGSGSGWPPRPSPRTGPCSTWPGSTRPRGHDDPSAEAVLREINGWGPDGKALSSFVELKADGSTTCGCWIYCGCYAGEVNQPARRKPRSEQSPVAPEWGWAWPLNRRVLYNRASADPDGKPWSNERHVWWDEEAGEWTGLDVPDFPKTKRPDYRPGEGARPAGQPATSRSSCGSTAVAGCSPPG